MSTQELDYSHTWQDYIRGEVMQYSTLDIYLVCKYMTEEMDYTIGNIKRLDFDKLIKQAMDEHLDYDTEEKFINHLHTKYIQLRTS